MIDRRDFLAGLSGTAVALSMPSAWATDALALQPLAEGLTLITGAGTNVVAARGPEGAVLVDGGLQAHAKALVKTALQATGSRKVQALFNTHWHPEATGANELLGREGVKIYAHKNTQLWLTRKIAVDWLAGTYGPLPLKALPTETTYTKGTLSLGPEQVDYGYLPQAHTDGDLYVFFRQANVLIGGGVLSGDRWPLMDYQTGGWIAGLIAGLDSLIKLGDEHTRFIPADGPLLTLADLKAQRVAYFSIYEKLIKCLTKGLGPDETLATEPAKGIYPAWGDSSPFVMASFKSLWGHYAPDA